MADCRQTIEDLLGEMLLAGFGNKDSTTEDVDENQAKAHQLLVQQVKSTDIEGNLRTVYPSKTDLHFAESANISIERDWFGNSERFITTYEHMNIWTYIWTYELNFQNGK